jgi:hypothetical protein
MGLTVIPRLWAAALIFPINSAAICGDCPAFCMIHVVMLICRISRKTG